MNFVALRMLTGDRAKYLGLIFAIAFCTFCWRTKRRFSRAFSSAPAARFSM